MIAEAGYGVILSSCVVEHHIGSSGIAQNLAHRIRWVRSTRRSRPRGYVGEVFTNPLPVALALWLVLPAAWPLLAATVVFRASAGAAVGGWVLRDSLCARYFWALPLEDVLAFAIWVAGFFGNRITWRGRNYYLHRDGRFELIGDRFRFRRRREPRPYARSAGCLEGYAAGSGNGHPSGGEPGQSRNGAPRDLHGGGPGVRVCGFLGC